MAREMEIVTPLGGDELLFHGMNAHEELGRLSEFEIDLLSLRKDIDPNALLGQPVTVKLLMPKDKTRYFNGFVTRFSQSSQQRGKYYAYHATVHPMLWFLTRRANCRIFQEKPTIDILKQLLQSYGVKFQVEAHARGKDRWEYCVQYRETDFNFISRLMEYEGIYYYFTHENEKHTMVLTDGTHNKAPGYQTLRYIEPQQLVRPDEEHISSWDMSRRVQPGKYAHVDYDFVRADLFAYNKAMPGGHSYDSYEVFDYPGGYKRAAGEELVAVRMEELRAEFERFQAVTTHRGIQVGAAFTLVDSPRSDHNGKDYLITSASYHLEYNDYEGLTDERSPSYRCTFTALSREHQFRPRRLTPKPFVQGPQTAKVVEWADEHARVKVLFHWVRPDFGETNSCWIRVSSPWAGKGWGAISTPRVGHEVIVDFLEGDPDRPIITGRVYNGVNPPPFGNKGALVLSGVKSDTIEGSGFNEFSFDDTAGAERIYVHGQYNMDTVIEHDQTTTVHNCRTDRVDVDDSESIGKNQKWEVGVNRDATIGANETLHVKANRTKTVDANETITIGSNRNATVGASESLTVAIQRTHSVGANETITIGAAQQVTIGAIQAVTVGSNQTINVGSNQSTTVAKNQTNKIGSNQTTDVASNQTTKVGKNESTTIAGDEARNVNGGRATSIGKDDALTVGKNLIINAADSVAIRTGDASITMKKDGTIQIKGKTIIITASGKINMKADGDIVMKGSNILQN